MPVDLSPSDLHERLKSDWPEAPEQLHSGGWDRTYVLEGKIESHLSAKPPAGKPMMLDLCCGEGSTACYFGKKNGWSIVGIDIAAHAIEAADKRAVSQAVTDSVSFVTGSAFEMPFESASFDVVYGQDPDALASPDMKKLHAEIFRVLKPGGLCVFHHHWVPGRGWPKEKLQEYIKESGSDPVSCDLYVDGLAGAGFKLEEVEDVSALAAKHLGGQMENMKKRVAQDGSQLQEWLVVTEKWAREMPFGIGVMAVKPAIKSRNVCARGCVIS